MQDPVLGWVEIGKGNEVNMLGREKSSSGKDKKKKQNKRLWEENEEDKRN